MYTRILKIMCISVSICTVDEQNPAPVVNYEGTMKHMGCLYHLESISQLLQDFLHPQYVSG